MLPERGQHGQQLNPVSPLPLALAKWVGNMVVRGTATSHSDICVRVHESENVHVNVDYPSLGQGESAGSAVHFYRI